MKFVNTHLALGQGKSMESFFKKLFSYLFQRHAFSASLGNEAGFGLGVEFNPNGHGKEPLASRLNGFGRKC